MEVLRNRHPNVPYVIPDPRDAAADERYVILPGEDDDPTSAIGRPIGEEYFSVEEKLRYMDRHGIAISVMSLANPWLDFLPKHDAVAMSTLLNDDLQEVRSWGSSMMTMTMTTMDDESSAISISIRSKRACSPLIVHFNPFYFSP